MADHDDPFRYCIYCGVDCEDAHIVEPDHADDCPSSTGLWPVTERELNLCPHCHVPIHGFSCGGVRHSSRSATSTCSRTCARAGSNDDPSTES